MHPLKDIYVRLRSNFQTTYFVHVYWITFHVVKGSHQPPKHMKNEAKIVPTLRLVPLLEVLHTVDTYGRMFDDPFD